MRRSATVFSVVLLLGCVSAARAAQTMTFNWEDGVTTALGTMYNAVLENSGEQAQSGTRSLKYTKSPNTGTTPQAYIWWVTNCQDGDSITASFYVYDTTPGTNPSGRIWAHYTSDPNNINSYSGSASGNPTYSSGTGWSLLEWTWVFASSGDDNGIVIEARIYATTGGDSTIYVDNAYIRTTSNTATIYNAAGAVPVELVSFQAEVEAGKVILTWSTATEEDNLGFNVLRARGGDPMVRINTALIPGAGTTLAPQSYRFVDRDVMPATVYRYWLEQVDAGGATELFGPIVAALPDAPSRLTLSLAPQPVGERAEVRLFVPQETELSVALFDVAGRETARLWEGMASGGMVLTWDRGALAPGLYVVRAWGPLGAVEQPVVLR